MWLRWGKDKVGGKAPNSALTGSNRVLIAELRGCRGSKTQAAEEYMIPGKMELALLGQTSTL